MPLIIDRAGKYIPQGSVARKMVDEPFLSGTLPASLLLASGTGTYNPLATSDGGYVITTAASSGATAELKTATGISTAVKSIRMDLEGLYFSSQAVQVDVAIAASGSVGAYIRQGQSDATASVTMGGVTTAIPYQLTGSGNNAGNHRTLTVELIPSTKELLIFENGEIQYIFKGASFTGGTASPGVKVMSQNTSAQWARMLGFKVTVFQN